MDSDDALRALEIAGEEVHAPEWEDSLLIAESLIAAKHWHDFVCSCGAFHEHIAEFSGEED